MDDLNDEMGIEMNSLNPYHHVPEAEKNNRVIKYRFIISYYRLTYQKIPSIIISQLAINVKQSLNIFTVKVGLSAHNSPHMILSQRNWGYNKHFQIELSAYVQSSRVNFPKNKNHLRTLDGIYLYHAPNLQSLHHIM